MYMIEISEKKYDKLSEHIEESLRHLGKAMSCLSEMGEPYGLGYRDDSPMWHHEGGPGRYGMRSRYDNYGAREDYRMRGGMGYRDDDDDDDDDMHERRRRSRRTGRYI